MNLNTKKEFQGKNINNVLINKPELSVVHHNKDKIPQKMKELFKLQQLKKAYPRTDSSMVYPELFLDEKFKWYYRINDRNSSDYKILTNLIGRDLDIIYPKIGDYEKRWFDSDVDREIWGSGFTFLAREEYKYTYNLKKSFAFGDNDTQRRYLKDTLADSFRWLKVSVDNFSCDKHGIERGRNGKGVIFYKFYTENLEYFSIINFTGTKLKNINTKNLRDVAEIIEPWASEFLNFLVEWWIRQDYSTVVDYFKNGVNDGRIKSSKPIDNIILNDPDSLKETINHKLQVEETMTEIMDVIHYETILNNPDRYLEFVEGVKQGQLVL